MDQLQGILDAWSDKAPPEAMREVRTIADEFATTAVMNYPPNSGQAFGTMPQSTVAA